jgi:hypothetical protein
MPAERPMKTPILDARDAILRHIRWRITLQLAIRMREPLSANAIQAIEHPEQCSVGQWIGSIETPLVRRLPEFRGLVECHLEFHRAMLEIAEFINRGEFICAERALEPDSRFRAAAQAISSAITKIDRALRTKF